jgi:hypothetical protein
VKECRQTHERNPTRGIRTTKPVPDALPAPVQRVVPAAQAGRGGGGGGGGGGRGEQGGGAVTSVLFYVCCFYSKSFLLPDVAARKQNELVLYKSNAVDPHSLRNRLVPTTLLSRPPGAQKKRFPKCVLSHATFVPLYAPASSEAEATRMIGRPWSTSTSSSSPQRPARGQGCVRILV